MFSRSFRACSRQFLLLGLVCTLLLGGCTPTSLLSAVHLAKSGPTRLIISEAVITSLFDHTPTGELYLQEGRLYLSLYCEISEGSMCYRVPYAAIEQHTVPDLSLRGAANSIGRDQTSQIFVSTFWSSPWKYVEHAEHNAVRVRCSRPEKAFNPVQCRVGFGRGWEAALVF